ncbi:MAG: hypothetical protein NC248_06780 [Bacteroides sp.]|nr:hypothetical protein [Bacteroides sp.]MCM1390527.1 hypothetical protein [Bacteroides sp.]
MSTNRILFTIFLAFIAGKVFSQNACTASDTIRVWTAECQKQYLNDRENPQKWALDKYVDDLKEMSTNNKQEPFETSVFPVPSYDLYPGTFSGIAAGNFNITLDSGQRIACVVNGNCRTALNETRLGDADPDIFMMLAVVTDFPVDTVNYDDTNVQGYSRNHPDVLTQGYVHLDDTHKVEFTSFITATDDAFAIINMRLFNLNDGHIIFIVPQTDGSLRSMQIKSDETLTFENCRNLMTSLINDNDKVHKFVTCHEDEFCRKAKQNIR